MSGEKGPTWHPRGHQDRDVFRDKHATPRGGVPTFLEEEITGTCSGDELERKRSRRPTPERFKHIERRQDEFGKVLAETREDIAKMSGSLETLVKIAEAKEQRWSSVMRYLPAIIKALGVAIAAVVTAYMLRKAAG